MFWSNYPAIELTRRRLLSSRGVITGVGIVGNGGSSGPDEAKYENSSMFISADLRSFYVLEWTGQDVEQHNADV